MNKDNSFYFIPHPSSLFLIASVWQHILHPLLIGFGHHRINVEIAFSLGALFSQDVARMRVTALDLAARGGAKSFGRTFMCFKFWHDNSQKKFAIFDLRLAN